MGVAGIEPAAFVLLRPAPNNGFYVGGIGIEPMTSVLSGQRSTTELAAHAVVVLVRGQSSVPVVETSFHYGTAPK